MITIDELKEKFPKPTTIDVARHYDGGREKCYCVGGTLCIYLKEQGVIFAEERFRDTFYKDAFNMVRFPPVTILAEALVAANPELKEYPGTTRTLSRRISDLNDEKKFDKAWATLDYALNFEPGLEDLRGLYGV